MGASTLWRRRQEVFPGWPWPWPSLATVVWAFVILGWSPDLVPGVALGDPGASASWPPWASPWYRGPAASLAAGLAGFGIASIIAAPAAYSLNTAATPHSGAIPSAGPGHPGRWLRRSGWLRWTGRLRWIRRLRSTGRTVGGNGFTLPPGFTAPNGAKLRKGCTSRAASPVAGRRLPGRLRRRRPAGSAAAGAGGFGGWFGGSRGGARAGGFGGGGAGGLLNGSTPGQAAHRAARGRRLPLHLGGRHHRLELGLRLPVGHRGPGHGHRGLQRHRPRARHWPSSRRTSPKAGSTTTSAVAVVSAEVAFGAAGTSDSSLISSWVASHYTATTVDGVTLYDLTTPAG